MARPSMADYFVYNRTDPQSSTNRVGIRLTSTAPDRVADLIAQYHAINASAATDVIEIVCTDAVISYVKSSAKSVPNAALPTAGT